MTKGRMLFWLIAWLIQIILIGSFLPSNFLQEQIISEREMTKNWMGIPTMDQLVTLSDASFNSKFVDTGAVKGSYRIIPNYEERMNSTGISDMGDGLWSYVGSRIEVFWLTIYQAVQRWNTLLMWLPYLLPIMIPAVVHGLCVREIKKVSYGYASPVVYHSAGHALAFILALPLFYITSPINIHPSAIFIWGVMFSLVVLTLTSNIQKQI